MTSRLVLTVLTGGTPRIRLVTPAGQQIRELRGPTPNSWASDFDPTAQEVLMEVYERGVSDLYRLVIETGRLARVTTTPWNEWHPSWSPDGRSLVFDTDSGGRTPRLTMLDVASGTRSPLTRGTRPEQGASGRLTGIGWPSIATRGSRATRTTTCSRSIAQRDTKCASRTTWRSGSPAWSPDGRKLAFSSNRNRAYEIYVACADGTGLSRLTTGGPDKKYPLWSPDGRRIVYQRRGEGIWTVDATAAPECGTSQR